VLVGRRRQSDFHLPQHVYPKHGAYHFRDPKTGRWTRSRVRRGAKDARGVGPAHGHRLRGRLVAWWLDRFLEHRRGLVKQGKLAARTLEDNETEAEYLKAFFGKMMPPEVEPSHVGDYLDQRGAVAWVRANREKSLLSGLFTWLMRKRRHRHQVQPMPRRGA
jgi:hypothetical protein